MTGKWCKTIDIGNGAQDFLDLDKVLAHKCQMYQIVGARDTGKTYAFKELAFKNWLENKEEFLYIRRYPEELRTKATLFDDILPEKGYEIKWNGFKCFIRKKGATGVATSDMIDSEMNEVAEWEPFGYCTAVSEQQQFKSTALPKVTLMCFDEFIIEKDRQQYIKNEVSMLFSLFKTVKRSRLNVKCIMLSNCAKLDNPYFTEYNIRYSDFANDKKGVLWRRNHLLGCFIVSPENTVKDELMELAPDSYRNYALNNKFLDEDQNLLQDTFKGDLRLYLKAGNNYIGLYANKSQIWLKLVNSIGNKEAYKYCLDIADADNEFIYRKQTVNMLKELWATGKLLFKDHKTKFTFRDYLRV